VWVFTFESVTKDNSFPGINFLGVIGSLYHVQLVNQAFFYFFFLLFSQMSP